MKNIKYFFQFIFIMFLFITFKIFGYKFSITISAYIIKIIGPIFRSNKISFSNLSIAFPKMSENEKNNNKKNVV